jgi:hypothetical protein
MYTVQQLERMPREKLDGLLAMKLFSASDWEAMKGDGWRRWSGIGFPRWNMWNDARPEQWACMPDNRIREDPMLSSSYEGMSRVIQKMVENGFTLQSSS